MVPIRFEFACCFCYKPGRVEGDEPVAVTISGAKENGAQTFYAHLECVRRAFHPQVRLEIPFPWDADDSDSDLTL
ncbi:MAG TPA: hypothetical protein VF746_06395 [Longimicrobium sp.]|jgi:hypothetical protein